MNKRGPKPKGRTAIQFRLTPALIASVTSYAEAIGQSRNDAVEGLLRRALKQETAMNATIIDRYELSNEFGTQIMHKVEMPDGTISQTYLPNWGIYDAEIGAKVPAELDKHYGWQLKPAD